MNIWSKMASEEEKKEWKERYDLAVDRLRQIPGEQEVQEPYRSFFAEEAELLLSFLNVGDSLQKGKKLSLGELERQNQSLYRDLLGENYASCYGNPDYAVQMLGNAYGPLFCFLYAELRGVLVYVYEDRLWDMLVCLELFLECYTLFAGEELPEASSLRDTLYWYVHDYSGQMILDRIRESLDPRASYAREILMQEDLTDLRYLYRFGEYVSETEKKTAAFLAELPEEEIARMARTFTEGFRLGFAAQKKDLHRKKTVNIRYRLGFERIIRQAVLQFKEMGLESVIYRAATHAVNRRGNILVGYYGALPNAQYVYDHRNDEALYLDERMVSRRLEDLREAYEACADLAAVHAGPAVMDVFGEVPFVPLQKVSVPEFSKAQQRLQVRYSSESGQLVNRYIPGEERSFTIIAYPVPEIGSHFSEIFQEMVRINTLDNDVYRGIQQKLIDVLDKGSSVHIRGRNGNRTDLTVALHPLTDPEKQTNFENCVADVNIPVGEVFTSPLLAGTNGVLHVSKAYLNELQYHDLSITLKNGMVEAYSCSNFTQEEKNRQFIEENLLFRHPTLPLGEFAIGTNTTAYRMAQKYGIADRLPILIAEKMGPHFALGDTCYSWQEDMAVYNPDGKEIIARDNECSLKRKEDLSKAYFGCHTDITIPYEELGRISVRSADGEETVLLENGRFVLPGTECLNVPLDQMEEER